MANTITVNFGLCDPAPANGYFVGYRVLGDAGPFTELGPFFASPVVIDDGNTNPDGSSFEGYVQADCGGGERGEEVTWVAEGETPEGFVGGSVVIPTGECIGELAITNIQYNGVDVVPIGGSFPVIPGQTLDFNIINPAPVFPHATIKLFLADVPPTGVLSLWGTDSNGAFSCDSGINPVDFELPFFAAKTEGDGGLPVSLEIHCGECP